MQHHSFIKKGGKPLLSNRLFFDQLLWEVVSGKCWELLLSYSSMPEEKTDEPYQK